MSTSDLSPPLVPDVDQAVILVAGTLVLRNDFLVLFAGRYL